MYYVEVTYPLDEMNWRKDQAIIRAGGSRNETGSGAGLGLRNIGFHFKTRRGAIAAAKRIRNAVRGVSAKVRRAA